MIKNEGNRIRLCRHRASCCLLSPQTVGHRDFPFNHFLREEKRGGRMQLKVRTVSARQRGWGALEERIVWVRVCMCVTGRTENENEKSVWEEEKWKSESEESETSSRKRRRRILSWGTRNASRTDWRQHSNIPLLLSLPLSLCVVDAVIANVLWPGLLRWRKQQVHMFDGRQDDWRWVRGSEMRGFTHDARDIIPIPFLFCRIPHTLIRMITHSTTRDRNTSKNWGDILLHYLLGVKHYSSSSWISRLSNSRICVLLLTVLTVDLVVRTHVVRWCCSQCRPIIQTSELCSLRAPFKYLDGRWQQPMW